LQVVTILVSLPTCIECRYFARSLFKTNKSDRAKRFLVAFLTVILSIKIYLVSLKLLR